MITVCFLKLVGELSTPPCKENRKAVLYICKSFLAKSLPFVIAVSHFPLFFECDFSAQFDKFVDKEYVVKMEIFRFANNSRAGVNLHFAVSNRVVLM